MTKLEEKNGSKALGAARSALWRGETAQARWQYKRCLHNGWHQTAAQIANAIQSAYYMTGVI